MSVSMSIGRLADDVDWQRLVALGPSERIAVLDGEQWVVMARTPSSVDRFEWRPRRLSERLDRLWLGSMSASDVMILFDGFDLALPSFTPSSRPDLRPLGLPFRNAAHVGDLLSAPERARDLAPGNDELLALAHHLEATARFCIKYGAVLRFHY